MEKFVEFIGVLALAVVIWFGVMWGAVVSVGLGLAAGVPERSAQRRGADLLAVRWLLDLDGDDWSRALWQSLEGRLIVWKIRTKC